MTRHAAETGPNPLPASPFPSSLLALGLDSERLDGGVPTRGSASLLVPCYSYITGDHISKSSYCISTVSKHRRQHQQSASSGRTHNPSLRTSRTRRQKTPSTFLALDRNIGKRVIVHPISFHFISARLVSLHPPPVRIRTSTVISFGLW